MTKKQQQQELERLRQEYLSLGLKDPERNRARHRYFAYKHSLQRDTERGQGREFVDGRSTGEPGKSMGVRRQDEQETAA